MADYNVLFFDGLNSYEVKSVNHNDFLKVVHDYLGPKDVFNHRIYLVQDPWMQRSPILTDPEDRTKKYILIPSNFSDERDIAVTTTGRFMIFCANDEHILSLSDRDICFVISELPTLFTLEKREEVARKRESDWHKHLVCSSYRFMLHKMSIKNALFLRGLFLDFPLDYLKLFKSITDRTSDVSCSDIYRKHCAGASDQEAAAFSNELSNAFYAFDGDFGLLFLVALHDKVYEEAFLKASQEDWLETFNNRPREYSSVPYFPFSP